MGTWTLSVSAAVCCGGLQVAGLKAQVGLMLCMDLGFRGLGFRGLGVYGLGFRV